MGKKYFWLKLKDDFFQDKAIKKLRKIAGGDTYTIIYLKLLLLSLKNDGILEFENIEDDFFDEIALDINEDSENVKLTISFLMKHGMVELANERDFFMVKSLEMTGSESESAERVRRHREQKALQCNNAVTVCNYEVTTCNTEKERELNLDKEKNKQDIAEVPPAVHDYELLFEKLWELYPSKKGKQYVSIKSKKAIAKLGEGIFIQCIKRYKDTKEDWRAYKDGSTFFNSGYKEYLDGTFQMQMPEENKTQNNLKPNQSANF